MGKAAVSRELDSTFVFPSSKSSVLDNSFSTVLMGRSSQRHCNGAMISALVELSAISVCNLLFQWTGQPANVIAWPVRDRCVPCMWAKFWCHMPAKLLSMHASRENFSFGHKMMPSVDAASKCQPVCFTAFSCRASGLMEWWAHMCAAIAMSG